VFISKFKAAAYGIHDFKKKHILYIYEIQNYFLILTI